MWSCSRNKFQLGDIVENTKLGKDISGSLIGIMNASHYCKLIGLGNVSNNLWTQIYPDWISKPVYYIWLDVPLNPITYEMYLGDTEDTPHTRFNYNLLPLTQISSLPEDDLKLIRGYMGHDS